MPTRHGSRLGGHVTRGAAPSGYSWSVPRRPPNKAAGELVNDVFSATADFVATGVITSIGVATLRNVDHPRSVLFAATPMLFALHQFTEAFVWLGLEGRIGAVVFHHSAFLFMLYAQGVLPLLMPLAVLLVEPKGWRRWGIAGATALGAVGSRGQPTRWSRSQPGLSSIIIRSPIETH